jgi:competence protein ComEC
MPIIHFLNVNDGDCSVITHYSGHVTLIDVCNAKDPEEQENPLLEKANTVLAALEKGPGNFNQKKYPVNPISYLRSHGISSVFRFIATHPDMDHLDGIKCVFEAFSPANFWDTDNHEEKDFEAESRYNEEDWLFYKTLRDGNPEHDPKRLTLHADAEGQYWNEGAGKQKGGDGLHILAPTPELVNDANECGDYNDCSYVILYRTGKHRILFAGDSHDKTWEHILTNHRSDVENLDVLIAPHHGRASDRSYDFLDVLNPKLTLFGNAKSEHLAYDAWNYRELPFVTNNQAGCIVIDAESDPIGIYVTHEPFARSENSETF